MKKEFSKFFSFDELTNSVDHPELVHQNRIDAEVYLASGIKLSFLLELIRKLLGNERITTSSGFRNPELNKAVGSKAKSSSHLVFKAADQIPSHMTVQKAFNILLANRDKLQSMRKCIIEKVGGKIWLHIQVKLVPSEPTQFFTTTDGKTYTEVK